jgi:hypothetical protein
MIFSCAVSFSENNFKILDLLLLPCINYKIVQRVYFCSLGNIQDKTGRKSSVTSLVDFLPGHTLTD